MVSKLRQRDEQSDDNDFFGWLTGPDWPGLAWSGLVCIDHGPFSPSMPSSADGRQKDKGVKRMTMSLCCACCAVLCCALLCGMSCP